MSEILKLQKLNQKLKYFFLATAISLLIFLFLPFTYFISQSQARKLFYTQKKKSRDIKIVRLYRKKRKIEKEKVLKKLTRPKLHRKDRIKNRFKLDLSLAMGGTGSLIQVNIKNIMSLQGFEP